MKATKKVVQLQTSARAIPVTMQRHHWSKQLRLSIRSDGSVLLSIPKRTSWSAAEDFLKHSREWIDKNTTTSRAVPKPTAQQKRQARVLVERKLQQWGPRINISWQSVRVGNQKTRWGSCSTKGTLSFSWRLLQLPESLVDYVVVHELCHLTHMNHSPDFWALVERHVPDYKLLRKQLKAFDIAGSKE